MPSSNDMSNSALSSCQLALPRHISSRLSAIAGILLALCFAYAIDRATDSEITFFLYLFPIGLTIYYFGLRAAYVVCSFAALIWLGAQPWQGIYAAAAFRALLFFLLSLLATRHQRAYRCSRDKLLAITQLLPLCPNCGQLFGLDGHWSLPERLHPTPSPLDAMTSHACTLPPQPPCQQWV